MSDKPNDMPQSSAQQAVGPDQAVTGETLAVSGQLNGPIAQNMVTSVRWNASEPSNEGRTFLTGTLTVAVALSAPFHMFVLAGIVFNIAGAAVGGTVVPFSYSGSQSAAAIKNLVVAGARIALVAN